MSVDYYEDIRVLHDFFPNYLLQPMVDYLENSNVRKLEFSLAAARSTQTPECVINAARFASSAVELSFNLAILKWYRLDDTYVSGAYEIHRDPPNRTSIPLFLCTLKGEADLIYWAASGREFSVRCTENMVLIIDEPTLPHKVSPPLGPDGERFFLFLGYDTEW